VEYLASRQTHQTLLSESLSHKSPWHWQEKQCSWVACERWTRMH